MKKERLKINCEYCSKEFYLLPCQMTRGRGKFCSKSCANLSRRNGDILYCAMCDKKFYRSKAEQDIGIRKNQFCSKDCYFDWRYANRKETTYKKIGAVHEHRLIAEKILKRKLTSKEIIHHIDCNRSNNNLNNLAVLPDQKYHYKVHHNKIKLSDVKKLSLENINKGVL